LLFINKINAHYSVQVTFNIYFLPENALFLMIAASIFLDK